MEKLEIHYQNLDAVKAEAIKCGMPSDDEAHSLFDFVDPSFGETRIFAGHKGNFEIAVQNARKFIHNDVWGCPRVYLLEWIGSEKKGYWEDRAFWEIGLNDTPDFQKPDCTI